MLTNYSKYWTTDDDDASRGEGWVLGANDAYGKVQLTRTRKDAKFDSDNAAVLHVVTEAAKGSRRHLLALILLGTGTRPHTAPPVPDLLLDTSIDIIDTETDEDKGLLVTHNGISVYWAEKDDDCLSTCMVAMSPHIWDGPRKTSSTSTSWMSSVTLRGSKITTTRCTQAITLPSSWPSTSTSGTSPRPATSRPQWSRMNDRFTKLPAMSRFTQAWPRSWQTTRGRAD